MSPNLNFTRCLGALTILALSTACAKKEQSATDTTAAVVSADTTAAVAAAPLPAPPPSAASAAPVSLTIATKPGIGAYLTDDAGRAVYVLDDGKGTKVACTGTCVSDFQPVAGKAIAAAHSSPLKANLIGVTTLSDGTVQVTYAGNPLYYSSADLAASTVNAQAKKSGTTTSYLVSPSGSEIKKKPTS
jgi:predicted lipoprotein with Yx(FWY)xxD motif